MQGRTYWALIPSAMFGALAIALAALVLPAVPARHSLAAPPANPPRLDPTAWGTDHVGQPLPDFQESGECLFCHRTAVGIRWQNNKHSRTMREPEADDPALAALKADPATRPFAKDVQLIVGDTRAQRFLKRPPESYGKADLLSTGVSFGRGRRARLDAPQNAHWDSKTFALECAGCHATGIHPETHAFSLVSLDCFACHGDSPQEHSNDTTLMSLAKARKDSPAVVTSICASCHVRFGKSQASGLPYPTNFVAGDNVFKDFQFDFDRADDPKLNPADGHVLDNVRDVALYGRTTMTCLTCHDVHSGSSKKHRELASEQSCLRCHEPGTPIKGHKTYEVHSERCKY